MYNRYDSYPEDYSIMARLVPEITWVDWRSKPSLELQERYQKSGIADLSVNCGA